MTFVVKVRHGSGKWISASASELCLAAFQTICNNYGWPFLMMWLGKYCLLAASEQSMDKARADLWIERYKAIREIR